MQAEVAHRTLHCTRAGYPAHPAGNAAGVGLVGGSTGYPVCVPSDGCACRVSLASGPGSWLAWSGCGRSWCHAGRRRDHRRRRGRSPGRDANWSSRTRCFAARSTCCDATASARSSTSCDEGLDPGPADHHAEPDQLGVPVVGLERAGALAAAARARVRGRWWECRERFLVEFQLRHTFSGWGPRRLSVGSTRPMQRHTLASV